MSYFYFYSDKSQLKKESLPIGFTDLFPITNVHEKSSIFLLRDSASAGALFRLRSCQPEQMLRLGHLLNEYMRTTSLTGDNNGLTFSIFKKSTVQSLSPEAKEDGGKTGPSEEAAGEQSQILRIEGLLAVVSSADGLSAGGNKKGLAHLLRRAFGLSDRAVDARLIDAADHVVAAAAEISELLASAGLTAERLTGGEAMLDAAKYFWSASADKNEIVRGEDESCDPIGTFANNFSLVSHRLFWKEKDALRIMSSLRTPPPEAEGVTLTTPEETQRHCIDAFFSIEETGMPGLLVLLMSSGGGLSVGDSSAVSGSLIAKSQAKFWRLKGDRGDASQKDNEDSENGEEDGYGGEGFKIQLKNSKKSVTLSQGTLRLAAIHITSLSWKEELSTPYGTFSERKAVSEQERHITSELISASKGADWQTIDTMWLETLYALVPGATRLDNRSATTLFDITHLPAVAKPR